MAGFWRRFAASFIDVFLIVVLYEFFFSRNFIIMEGVRIIYETVLISLWNGQTIGKKLMNIRVIKTDGWEVGGGYAFIRAICKILSSIPLGLGYFWMLWDENSQTWHDKLAGTYVVKKVS